MTQNQANYFEINLIQTMLNQCPLDVYFNEANKLNKQIAEVPGGWGGRTPIWKRRGCSSEILNLTPKGGYLGVAQAFCDP